MADREGTIFWAELYVRDMAATKRFYGDVVGWRFDTMPLTGGDGEYVVAASGDKAVAGIIDMTLMDGMDEVPPHWLTYIAVDDVDAKVAVIEAAGGALRRPLFDVPNVGRIAIVEDAEGAILAMMTQVR